MKLDEDIRHLFYVEKLSQRAIAKKLGISRNTVRRYCTAEKTSDMRKVRSYDCPVTGPIKEKVKMWLDEENTTSPKKRLTSEQIYQRLVQEGFSGGASTVRKLVHELRFGNKQNIESLYEEFLRVVTAGKGYQGIADLLANKLQVSILIEDEYFRVLARSR